MDARNRELKIGDVLLHKRNNQKRAEAKLPLNSPPQPFRSIPMKKKIDLIEFSRKGGNTTKAKYGSEHYKKIQQKGSVTTKEKYGRDHYVKMGRRAQEVKKQREAQAKKTPMDRVAEALSGA